MKAETRKLVAEILKDNTIHSYNEYYDFIKKKTLKIENIVKNEIDKNELSRFQKDKEKLYEVYRNVLKGNLQTASTKLRNLLYAEDFLTRMRFELSPTDLFRCRKNIDKNRPFDEEMFHIPFNMRHIIGNYRYSISGFPCLYLGDSIDCCLAELDLIDCSDVVMAKYELMETVQYYDFSMNEKFFEYETNIFLKIVLLELFCGVQINHDNIFDNAKFFSFYVIPQLVTACIASKSDNVRCICYASTKKEDGVNYVFIPKIQKLSSKNVYDSQLKKLFSIERITS